MRTARNWSITKLFSSLFSLVALAGLLAMVGLFIAQSLPVWRQEGWGFLTGKKWFYRQHEFGAAAMIYGTCAVAVIAMALAAPIGIGAAIFTAEYLPRRLRLAVKIAVELLAGIPSVVYGLLGILILGDWIYEALQPFDPLSDDALRSVPSAQRQAARGLGLTSTETVLHVSLPQAAPGIVAAVLLAMGRALGEMIAVFLVVGRQDNQWPASVFSLRPLAEAGQTLSSKLGSAETNIGYGDPLHWAAMVGLGLLLLAMVTALTLIGAKLQRWGREHAA